MILRAETVQGRLTGIAFGSMLDRSYDFVVTRNMCCGFGSNTFSFATLITVKAAS